MRALVLMVFTKIVEEKAITQSQMNLVQALSDGATALVFHSVV
jgi:hypothetical protein